MESKLFSGRTIGDLIDEHSAQLLDRANAFRSVEELDAGTPSLLAKAEVEPLILLADDATCRLEDRLTGVEVTVFVRFRGDPGLWDCVPQDGHTGLDGSVDPGMYGNGVRGELSFSRVFDGVPTVGDLDAWRETTVTVFNMAIAGQRPLLEQYNQVAQSRLRGAIGERRDFLMAYEMLRSEMGER